MRCRHERKNVYQKIMITILHANIRLSDMRLTTSNRIETHEPNRHFVLTSSSSSSRIDRYSCDATCKYHWIISVQTTVGTLPRDGTTYEMMMLLDLLCIRLVSPHTGCGQKINNIETNERRRKKQFRNNEDDDDDECLNARFIHLINSSPSFLPLAGTFRTFPHAVHVFSGPKRQRQVWTRHDQDNERQTTFVFFTTRSKSAHTHTHNMAFPIPLDFWMSWCSTYKSLAEGGGGGGGGGTIIQWRMARSNKMFFTAEAVMHGGARGHFPMNK